MATNKVKAKKDRKMKEFKWFLPLSSIAHEHLFEHIGTGPVIFMIAPAFVNMTERMDAVSKGLGWPVVWISKHIRGLMKTHEGRLLCSIDVAIGALSKRKDRGEAIFLTVHAAASFECLFKLQEVAPGAKLVSYAYDWMHLFVPREKRHMWAAYDPQGKGWPEAEYDALEGVISGTLADGVMYKDCGHDFPMLKGCKSPTLWSPNTLPIRLAQPQPPLDVPNRAVYIGTIVSEKTHRREHRIFEDIFMEEIFDAVSRQGVQIDAYSLEPMSEVIAAYNERFPTGRVKLYQGRLLGQLLPHLRQRYRWGWMLYYQDCEMIMPHIKITIPSKIFTYLMLGIPILISEEFEACVRIIREYNCGVVLSRKDINENIISRLDSQDYAQLLEGVARARNTLCLERIHDDFLGFLKKVKEAPYARSTPTTHSGTVRVRHHTGKNTKHWPLKNSIRTGRVAKHRRR